MNWIIRADGTPVLAIGVAVLVVIVIVLWVSLRRIDAFPKGRERKFELKLQLGKLLLQIAGFLLVVFGGLVTWSEFQSRENAQRSERFDRAVNVLGSTDEGKRIVRVAAMYTLGSIVQDAAGYRSPVIDILANYARERSKANFRKVVVDGTGRPLSPAVDIQAAVRVLGSLVNGPVESFGGYSIDLRETDLSGIRARNVQYSHGFFWRADLREASFGKSSFAQASFAQAAMQHAVFVNCDLSSATFEDLDLSNGYFHGSNLQHAKFQVVNLYQADFTRADLTRAIFVQANLTAAILHDADLSGAIVSQSDLDAACLNSKTVLPQGVTRSEKAPRYCWDDRIDSWGTRE